jgi:hypothetical protein
MNNSGLRNWFFRCLLWLVLVFAFAQLVACSSSSNNPTFTALIVYDTTGGTEETNALANLNTLMTDIGYTNVTTSDVVPSGDLSGYGQIWDIRYDVAITNTEQGYYETYLQGGGTLVLTGQYASLNDRDTSITTLINAFGGGTMTLTTPNPSQTVQSYFTGPYPVTNVTYPDPTTLDSTSTLGTGTYITEDGSGYASAIYFYPSATAGTLMVVFDTNFLNSTDPNIQNLTANMLYLY